MHVLPFANEPIETFAGEEARASMRTALAQLRSHFGRSHPAVIGGRRVQRDGQIVSVNPSAPSQIVGTATRSTREDADAAIEAAWQAFDGWRRWPQEDRSRIMLKAAAIMRRRKRELEAGLVLEIGKNWVEASAEVAEIIDFTEYYARQALRHAGGLGHLNAWPGEENQSFYIPLGAGLTIAPWNFPLALMTGMTVGAIAVGNTTVCKPAEDTVVAVAKMAEIFEEAGLPPGVVNYLPGAGTEVGAYLVEHPRTRFVNFTGSLATGRRINEAAAKVGPGQRWFKRVFLELGGKDAILVDETADLDAAALGVVQSAFGYQGQKCSACSRLVVVDSVYGALIERVVERAKTLRVAAAETNPDLGPVCNAAQDAKVDQYLHIGREEGTLLTGGRRLEGEGYFFEPTVFGDLAPGARLAQEEVFGPVLAAIRVKDFEQGLAVVNDSAYGLTGAVFTRDRERIATARREFHVGNLYFNRKCTGALAGVQPFGGFNLTGTDTKTGGPDYLLQFLQMKSVAERL
jgi:1-pyrroline-5-carboxylate dehydrogenase